MQVGVRRMFTHTLCAIIQAYAYTGLHENPGKPR
jgi:hypothetical protein